MNIARSQRAYKDGKRAGCGTVRMSNVDIAASALESCVQNVSVQTPNAVLMNPNGKK